MAKLEDQLTLMSFPDVLSLCILFLCCFCMYFVVIFLTLKNYNTLRASSVFNFKLLLSFLP